MGWAPLVRRDRGPPPFGDCGSVVPRHRALVERAEGRRPTNWPDSLLPGWHPRRDSVPTAPPHRKEVLSNQLGWRQRTKGGPKDPRKRRGGHPRTLASRRHRLLQGVAATAGVLWTAVVGLLEWWLFPCSFQSLYFLWYVCSFFLSSSSSLPLLVFWRNISRVCSLTPQLSEQATTLHLPVALSTVFAQERAEKLLSTLKALSRVTVARCLPLPERRRPKDRS